MNYRLSEKVYPLRLVVVLEDAKEQGKGLVCLRSHELAALNVEFVVRNGSMGVYKDDQSILDPFLSLHRFRHAKCLSQEFALLFKRVGFNYAILLL